MDSRGRLRVCLGVVAIVFGLAGCTDALTVWPVAAGVQGDAPVDVPAVAGTWRMADEGPEGPTLDIDQVPGEHGTCRGGLITYTESGNARQIGDQTCLINIGGNLIAEVRSVEPIKGFFRQYLVRVTEDRIEVCTGLPVWVGLQVLQKERPVGYALESLDYTLRERGEEGDLMIFISQPARLREFLALSLPELVAACDTHDDNFSWVAFERAEPESPADKAQ